MTLDYTDANDNQPYTTQTDTDTVTVTAPDITISKEADVEYADPDDVITYTITYINSGNGYAGNVWVNETLPAHTTFEYTDTSGYTVVGNEYCWHFTNVAPGTYTIIFKVRINIGTDTLTVITNQIRNVINVILQ